MAWVSLRQFAWTTKTNLHGVPEVVGIEAVSDPRRLQVDVSDVILTNAFATTVSRPILYDATLHELRLIGSYLDHSPHTQVRLQGSAFHASARHIRSFISESVGLGMLTAAVQAAYRWYGRGRVHNLDALPTSLAGRYARRGARPDLLFDLPAVQLAGEARGRSRRAPYWCLKEHFDRLNQLLPWAAHHQHNLVMTWTYLTGDGITVDWFMPEAGVTGLGDRIGEPLAPDWLDRPEAAAATWMYETAVEDSSPGDYTRFDETSPFEVQVVAQRRRAQIEQNLFATAPQTELPTRVAGRTLRGAWVPLDLVGPSTGSLLLAILDEPLSPVAGWEVTEQLRRRIYRRLDLPEYETLADARSDDTPLSVTVRGRLLVAVASQGFDQPWDLLTDESDR